MWDLYERVVACAEGAARATGTEIEVHSQDVVYEPMDSNGVLLDLFADNMRALGLTIDEPVADRTASSDIGNVSQIIPTIHPWIAIAPEGMAIHTREFLDSAVSPLARAGLLAGAKAMAMTTLDLLANPALVARAQRRARKEVAWVRRCSRTCRRLKKVQLRGGARRPPRGVVFYVEPAAEGANEADGPFSAACENRFGQGGGDDPVRGVDDLADREIDGHAREDIGLLAAEPALLHQVIDHVADGLLG